MKEQNPTRKDESIKTDNEICEMCAKESEEPEKNIAQEENGWVSLGSYYLPAGRVTVTLTDKASSVFVSADAVKFTLIK